MRVLGFFGSVSCLLLLFPGILLASEDVTERKAASSHPSLQQASQSSSQPDLQELLHRIEMLERQNQELRATLEKLQQQLPKAPASVPKPPIASPGQEQPVEASLLMASQQKPDPDELKSNPWKLIELRDPSPWIRVNWQNGLGIQSSDGSFRIHVGGRTQFDTVWLTASDRVQNAPGGTGKLDDAFFFRRARFTIDGKIFNNFEFWCEYDFVNAFDFEPVDPARETDIANTPATTDLYGQIVNIPIIGNIRLGNHKPPISFEHLSSSRWLNFIERSFMFDAFIGGLDNGFRPGVQIFNWTKDENITWQIGVYKNNTTVFGFNAGDGEYDLTGRITWTPIYLEGGKYLVHLGLGASMRDLDNDRYRLRARGSLRDGPGPIATAFSDVTFLGNSMYILVPEFALVYGPWSVVVEYYTTWFTDVAFPIAAPVPVGDTFYHGGYIEVLYFLTGEFRQYLRRGGSGANFNRVIPDRNFIYIERDGTIVFAPGAWQVGVRYQYIDLVDKNIPGATLHDITLGLNWFLNPNAKIQWNYTITHRDAANSPADGWMQGFGMRLAFDF